ncbi:MAG TPA: outer membrane lipoprotein-sorting protein [Steroidobacteraceae bacterium]|nr:outer membrane lipoprotein-sorting protein [Steroidobacteraceae bacterium]
MKYLKHSMAILPIALSLCLGGIAHAQTAGEIVAATDKVRNPGQPFRTTLRLTEYVGGQERDHDSLVVFSKEDPASGQFRNLVQYVEPARDSGKRVLLDAHSLWFYDPDSKVSVRISAQQRLIGQAAIGDILTVNLAADYAASIVATETIDDATRQPRKCWHLELKARDDLATYNRVEYWVEQGSYYPIKGKFYSDSGRLLKIAYFRNFARQLGAVRPTEAIIIDAVDASLATTATFGEYVYQEIPEAWFQRDFLPRLQVK